MATASSSLLSFVSTRRRMIPSCGILLFAGIFLVITTGGLAARLDPLDGKRALFAFYFEWLLFAHVDKLITGN